MCTMLHARMCLRGFLFETPNIARSQCGFTLHRVDMFWPRRIFSNAHIYFNFSGTGKKFLCCTGSVMSNYTPYSKNKFEEFDSDIIRSKWNAQNVPGSNQFLCNVNTILCHSKLFSNKHKVKYSAYYLSTNTPQGQNGDQSPASRKTGSDERHDSLTETVEKEDIVLTVPNVLTTLRMGMTPVLGYMVVHEAYAWACAMFVLAGITDLLDGWIARNFRNQTSALGSFIDPLADKFLISVLFVTLSMVGLIPAPLTALVISRDVLLILAAFYVRYISLPPPKTLKRYFDITKATAELHPTFISKLNTAVQLSLVTFTLAAPVFGYVDHTFLKLLWLTTSGTTIASGISYLIAKDSFEIIKQTVRKKKK